MLLLLLFLSTALATTNCTRDNILSWVSTRVDLNGDGVVNITEVNHYVHYNPCNSYPRRFTGESAMRLCDKNGDMELSIVDYDAPKSCINIIWLKRMLCMEYNKCL